jgi:hypothetical protein
VPVFPAHTALTRVTPAQCPCTVLALLAPVHLLAPHLVRTRMYAVTARVPRCYVCGFLRYHAVGLEGAPGNPLSPMLLWSELVRRFPDPVPLEDSFRQCRFPDLEASFPDPLPLEASFRSSCARYCAYMCIREHYVHVMYCTLITCLLSCAHILYI